MILVLVTEMDNDFTFLDDLNEKQREICLSDDNIILKACPGSGKTRTLTYRLAYISKLNWPSVKLNIAITYTNRAAEEIKKRLENFDVESSIWAGTIHQFCLEYIIRPYSMYNKRLSYGYHIIDEYIKEKYVKEIVTELGMAKKVKYKNPLLFPEIYSKYIERLEKNKEIDFDSILNISYELLSDNRFIRGDIADIIRSIHIDEYQDTNELQYKILGQIVQENKGINVLFVGDIDQAIYQGIGGIAKDKNEIEKEFQIKFAEKNLDGCYRSSQRVIDYYLQFQQEFNPIKSLSTKKDSPSFIYYNKTIKKDKVIEYIAEIVKKQLSNGVPEKEICIVAPQWGLLYPISKKIRNLLPEVNFDAPDITPIKYDPMNVFFIISKLVFTEAGKDTWLRKKYASDLISILENEYKISLTDNVDNFLILKYFNSVQISTNNGIKYLQIAIEWILKQLKVDIESHEQLKKAYTDFIEKVLFRIDKYQLSTDIEDFKKCFKEKSGVVISSCHGVKGEEFTTVIALGLLKGYIPHWDLIINYSSSYCNIESKKLLYVVCSRAKENIFLFSEQGRVTSKGDNYEITDELNRYKYNYDKEIDL